MEARFAWNVVIAVEGLEHMRRAISREPSLAELHEHLVTACVWLDRIQDAAMAVEGKLAAVQPGETDYLRAASIHAQLQEWLRAAEMLRAGLAQFPESEKLRAALAEIESQQIRA